jgi:hypothetical protein
MTAPEHAADVRLSSQRSSPSEQTDLATTPDGSRAPPLCEMQGATMGEGEAQPQPVPDYEYDQRIAW